MKKHLLVALVLAGAAVGSAHAQTFTAPAGPSARERVERPVTPLPRRAPVGAVPRAARGNPLQMVNPKAPAQYYGPPNETVSAEQPDRPKNSATEGTSFPATGIILFGLRF